MVEQIDAMIRSAYVMATRTEDLPPNLDAQDRIIKLLDRKAKLLGLDQVPAQDIRVKLQQLSQEGNYDLEELEDIARVVLARHRFQIVSPTDETSPGSESSRPPRPPPERSRPGFKKTTGIARSRAPSGHSMPGAGPRMT